MKYAPETTNGVTWNVSGSADNISVGNDVAIKSIKLSLDPQNVTVAGTLQIGTDDPLNLAITGGLNEGSLSLNVKGSNIKWGVLPKYTISAEGNVSYDVTNNAFEGVQIAVKAAGKAGDATNTVSLNDPQLSVEASGTGAAGQVKISIKVNAEVQVASMAPDQADPLTLGIEGSAEFSPDGIKLNLSVEQANTNFYVTDAVIVNNINFKLAYTSAGASAANATPKSTINASFKGAVTADLPAGKTLNAQVDAAYNDGKLDFHGNASGQDWKVAPGLGITKLEIAYRSKGNQGDFTPTDTKIPTLKNFDGFAVVGTFNSSSGFLYDTVGLKGELATYVRIDSSVDSYEAAVVSDGTWQVVGDAGKPGLAISKPFVKVTRTGKTDKAPAATTVALGGTGVLTYPSGSSTATYDGLNLGASFNATTNEFSGSLAIKKDKPWTDAGGITGLTIRQASIDLTSSKKKGEPPISASIFANVAMDEVPGFLRNGLGLKPGTPMSFGVGMGKNWCAALTMGDSASKEAVMRPLTFAGKPLQDAIGISYADLVYASGKCMMGARGVEGSRMALKGNLLGTVPIDINVGSKPQPGGATTQLATDEGGADIASTAFGPATIESAKLNLALNTAAKTGLQAPGAPGDGPSVGLAGSFALGGQKLNVAGNLAVTADGKNNLQIGMKAGFDAAKPLKIGAFEMISGQATATVVFDTKTRKIDEKNFAVGIEGKAKILDSLFGVSIAVKYAGGAVQAASGSLDAERGVAVADRFVIKGKGAVAWEDQGGLKVVLGDEKATSSNVSLLVCDKKAIPATDKTEASCEGDSEYGVKNAYVNISDAGFAAAGTVKLGPGAKPWFQGRVTGAYYKTISASDRPKIYFNGVAYDAQAGDYSFGLEDAKISLPIGEASGSIAFAKFHKKDPPTEVIGGRLAFAAPVLSGKVSFDGAFDTTGLYRIAVGAKGLKVGGIGVNKGEVVVANRDDKGTSIPTTIDIKDLEISALDVAVIKFSGKIGSEDGVNGVRLNGSVNVKAFGGMTVDASVLYSNFPKDAGFGFGFGLKIPKSGVAVNFSGTFRNINNQSLYRVTGSIEVPVYQGVVAVGTAQLDNCDDVDKTSCAKKRDSTFISVGAGVKIGGGSIEISVRGDIRTSGAFRLVGTAKYGVRFGPWGFFKVVSAEAGFDMRIQACLANDQARTEGMACGLSQTVTWDVDLRGSAYAAITLNLFFWSTTQRLEASVRGRIEPGLSQFCAVFYAFGYGVTFGTCPPASAPLALGGPPPSIVPSGWV